MQNLEKNQIFDSQNVKHLIAFQWLDAQIKTKHLRSYVIDIKHLVEDWAGFYISKSDVLAAARYHKYIFCDGRLINISLKLVKPRVTRLNSISEKSTHFYNDKKIVYFFEESIITNTGSSA